MGLTQPPTRGFFTGVNRPQRQADLSPQLPWPPSLRRAPAKGHLLLSLRCKLTCSIMSFNKFHIEKCFLHMFHEKPDLGQSVAGPSFELGTSLIPMKIRLKKKNSFNLKRATWTLRGSMFLLLFSFLQLSECVKSIIILQICIFKNIEYSIRSEILIIIRSNQVKRHSGGKGRAVYQYSYLQSSCTWKESNCENLCFRYEIKI
jgi:hypothetical protein